MASGIVKLKSARKNVSQKRMDWCVCILSLCPAGAESRSADLMPKAIPEADYHSLDVKRCVGRGKKVSHNRAE